VRKLQAKYNTKRIGKPPEGFVTLEFDETTLKYLSEIGAILLVK
jgi:hypothetical protein